ncbi:hypothetical protein DBR06_SOUSAS3710144, partial [Sousa chinensis]
DGKRQEIQLKRRGSDSRLLTQRTAQLPSSVEWEEVTLCASLYRHPQCSVETSEEGLLLAKNKTLLSWKNLANVPSRLLRKETMVV